MQNPCQIKNVGVERAIERPTISASQVWAAAEHIGGRYHCAVLLAGFMGVRLGDILGLERRHVDLSAAELTINQQEQQLRDGELIVTSPKSIAGRRTISIPAFMVPELASHLERFA